MKELILPYTGRCVEYRFGGDDASGALRVAIGKLV